MLIRKLTIQRYQGIESLTWLPGPGLNAIVGPADAGKSTILSAIGLLLTPRASPSVSEYDYNRRRLELGFEIEAVVGQLTESLLAALDNPPIQGWRDGGLQALPEDGAEPVLVIRVTGTPDFEVVHNLVLDDHTTSAFSVAMRQQFLFTSRLLADDVARNELRLVRGSALERRLAAASLRPVLTEAVANASTNLAGALPAGIATELAGLKDDFAAAGIPSDLTLGIVAQEGYSPMGLLGLVSGPTPDEAIPVFRFGMGTRRLALAWVPKLAADSGLIITADEPEIGLEPYRQRALLNRFRNLAGATGQAFITTHSLSLLAALRPNELWRLVPGGTPTALATVPPSLLAQAPETFLCRLAVLCEGPTEAGFLGPMLASMAARDGKPPLDERGIVLVDRTGQPFVLTEAKAILDLGMACGLFVDAENDHSGRRTQLEQRPECAFGTWDGVRNVEEAVSAWLPIDRLESVVQLAATVAGIAITPFQQQLGQAAEWQGARMVSDVVTKYGEPRARTVLATAMQDRKWFKSVEGGRALAEALLIWGVPAEVQAVIDAFWARLNRLDD